jgi:hypothetical protein
MFESHLRLVKEIQISKAPENDMILLYCKKVLNELTDSNCLLTLLPLSQAYSWKVDLTFEP